MTTTPEDLAAFPNRYAVEREIEAAENPAPGTMHLNDGHERVRLPGGTLRRMLAVIDQLAAMASGAQHGEPVDRSAVIGLFDCWAYETLPGTPVDCDKVNALSAQIVRALTRPTAPAEPAERAVDESAIQRMTAAGREAWKGVPDASAWVDEMRGEPADPVTEARLPTPVRKRIDAAAHAMSLAMAHYELKHHTDDFARALAGLRALQANDTTKGK